MIDVALTRAQLRPAQVTVVIDALRATSTAVAGLGAGYRRVLFADSLDAARGLRAPGRVLAGERDCLMPDGFDHGNSPADARRRRGDELVLTTTNGAPAIVAATRVSELVLVASMLNLEPTIARLRDVDGDLQLVCSGSDGIVALEDVYVAGRIASALPGRRTDTARLAQATCHAYGDPLEAFAASAHAARLRAVGLQTDIIACARETEPSIVAVAVAYGERMACAVRETAGDEQPVTAQRRAASIASQTRDGVQGMSTCLTP
jgi:2-phosphosulfolactate phosphatase